MAEPGTYKGRHYTEWVDEAKRLKRESLLDEAETLLLGLIGATEAETQAEGRRSPAPWYYQNLAIVYRKQRRYLDEISVLTRYEDFTGDHDGMLAERLRKARRLQEKAEAIANPSTTCPYCAVDLGSVPQRTGACPDCGERILVRTVKGTKLMMTEAQREEEQRQKVRDKALTKANRAGASTAEFDAEEEALRERLGVALPMDVFWSLANRKAIEGAAASDWFAAASAYRAMAERLVEEGKDPYGVHAKAMKYWLMTRLEYTPPDRVLFVSGCDCPPCQVEPRKLTFAEALENPPIPHVECEEKICRCHLMDDWGEESDSRVIHIDVSVAVEGEERQKAAAGTSGSGEVKAARSFSSTGQGRSAVPRGMEKTWGDAWAEVRSVLIAGVVIVVFAFFFYTCTSVNDSDQSPYPTKTSSCPTDYLGNGRVCSKNPAADGLCESIALMPPEMRPELDTWSAGPGALCPYGYRYIEP